MTDNPLQAMRRAIEDFPKVDPSTMATEDKVEFRSLLTDKGVPCEWIRHPTSLADRRLLYLHGGGWCAGSFEGYRPLCARISETSGCSLLLAGYRLAPEHPFPAALADCVAAYTWMCINGPDARNEATRTFIAGDSAGGNLVLATLLALKERDLQVPDAAVCLSPVTDFTGSGESMKTRAGLDPTFSPEMLSNCRDAYLRSGEDPTTPLASPLYGELSGLPPLLLQVGDTEVLLDDTIRFAKKARGAGIKVDLEIWPEMVHVFQLFAPYLPESTEAISRIGEFLQRHSAPAARC